jgi:membrane protein involved in colicin uptake
VAASIAPGGFDGNGSASIAREVSAAAAATEKVVEMAKAVEEAEAVKVAADKATTEKVDVDKATVTKAAEEAVARATVDAAAMKTADQGAAVMKSTMELVGFSSGPSPAPAVGFKRAATPGGSTPSSKWFRYTWKPRYAEQLCSHPLLFIYLYCI